MSNQDPTVEQRAYHVRVRELGCIVCGAFHVVIAHTHGARLTALGFHKPKGIKRRWMHWLVVPLCETHHWLFDHRSRAFEATYGDAVTLLAAVMSQLRVDVYSRARAMLKPGLPARLLLGRSA